MKKGCTQFQKSQRGNYYFISCGQIYFIGSVDRSYWWVDIEVIAASSDCINIEYTSTICIDSSILNQENIIKDEVIKFQTTNITRDYFIAIGSVSDESKPPGRVFITKPP